MWKVRAWLNSKAGYTIVFFIFGVFVGLNKDIAVTLLGFYFFPIEKEYIFTYDKNFDCSRSDDYKAKAVCGSIKELQEKIARGELKTDKFGIFEKPFLEFIEGKRTIKFYFAKNIEEYPSKIFSGGVKSFYDRLKFYFWNRSVRKSGAFSIALMNKIYLGRIFFQFPGGSSHTMAHEILHLCWATEEEVGLLGY